MQIIGSFAEAGLGLVQWWPEDEAEQEVKAEEVEDFA